MRSVAALLVAAGTILSGAPAAAAVREWHFAAALDDRPIGEHVFRVVDGPDGIEVESRASFQVRFLGLTFYTYEHRATERWKDGCLAALDSRTDDNGTVETVTGTRAADGFEVTRGGTTTTLPSCVMTFAYWNPDIRTQHRLLNPQTGDYLDVAVHEDGAAQLEGERAHGWVIRGRNLRIEAWYDEKGRWLGLDSQTPRSGVVSYRLRPARVQR